MVFTIQKSRAGANTESPARNQPGTNMRGGINIRRPLFTREQNDLSIQRVLQYSQENENDELHLFVLGLNESSTEDDMKKYYRSLALQFQPDKNKHSQVTEVMKMMNEAKEELESTLLQNYEIREEERVHMDAMREEECVNMAQNAIIISSDDEYDSERR